MWNLRFFREWEIGLKISPRGGLISAVHRTWLHMKVLRFIYLALAAVWGGSRNSNPQHALPWRRVQLRAMLFASREGLKPEDDDDVDELSLPQVF